MWKILALVLCFVAITLAATTDAPAITVKNMRLFRGDSEYFIKGVSYNPVPLGYDQEDEIDSGGFCSILETVYRDEFKSACYDSDYANGKVAPALRDPPGPKGPWFAPLWKRDLPFMEMVGINTIRLYNANPVTRVAAEDDPSRYTFPEGGSSHISFLNMAAEHGMMVIFPLIGDMSIISGSNTSAVQELIRYQINEVGGHPAVLMYTFGNELPVYNAETNQPNTDLITKLNTFMDYIRTYQESTWSRTIPVTNCIVDLPPSYNYLYANLDVDVFCSNAGYRGFDFTNLFTGGGSANFSGAYKLGCDNDKPLLIGEMGWHSVNNAITKQTPNWINQQWQAVVNATHQGLIGTVFFEFNDEPTKNDPEQETMGLMAISVNYSNGKNSTTPDVFLPDIYTPKTVFYQAMNGTVNGVAFNFKSNIFELIGRNPASIDGDNIVCRSGSGSGSTSGVPSTTTGPSQNIPTFTPPQSDTTYQSTTGEGTSEEPTGSNNPTSNTNPTTSTATSTSQTTTTRTTTGGQQTTQSTTSPTSTTGSTSGAIDNTIAIASLCLLAIMLLF